MGVVRVARAAVSATAGEPRTAENLFAGIVSPAVTAVVDAGGAGTYTLVIELPEPIAVVVGALGEQHFPAGGYAYTGSALGAGGFSRIDRHARVAAGDHDVRHWHVDYFLGRPATDIVAVEVARDRDIECAVARDLPGGPVGGFGASDCDCRSHLARAESSAAMARRVRTAYADRGVDGPLWAAE